MLYARDLLGLLLTLLLILMFRFLLLLGLNCAIAIAFAGLCDWRLFFIVVYEDGQLYFAYDGDDKKNTALAL